MAAIAWLVPRNSPIFKLHDKAAGSLLTGEGGRPKVRPLLGFWHFEQVLKTVGRGEGARVLEEKEDPCVTAKGVFCSKRSRTKFLNAKILFQTLGSIPGAEGESGSPSLLSRLVSYFSPLLCGPQ